MVRGSPVKDRFSCVSWHTTHRRSAMPQTSLNPSGRGKYPEERPTSTPPRLRNREPKISRPYDEEQSIDSTAVRRPWPH